MCLEEREREREERIKREEREFQLKMVSMIMQAPGDYPYPPFSPPICPPADYGTSHDDMYLFKVCSRKNVLFHKILIVMYLHAQFATFVTTISFYFDRRRHHASSMPKAFSTTMRALESL